jgi:hypothetical protein
MAIVTAIAPYPPNPIKNRSGKYAGALPNSKLNIGSTIQITGMSRADPINTVKHTMKILLIVADVIVHRSVTLSYFDTEL